MINVLGGIGLFLLGMTMLTSSLKEVAGSALKKWLNRFTGGTISSVFSGVIMTILMQSSSATTLLTIGFVSAGLLTFTQSIGIVIGANIGSTSTAWIISLIGFKVSLQAMSLPIITLGAFIQLIAPRDWKAYGPLLTGFGLLFLGIDILQKGMSNVHHLLSFDSLQANTLWMQIVLIFIGFLLAVVMQASSASMAATLTAVYAGAIGFEQAAFLVIGQHIGTTTTALFASIGTTVSAKRTAMTHFLFNVFTAIFVVVVAPVVFEFTKWLTAVIHGSYDAPLALAVFHSTFSIIGALIFVPFIKPFATFVSTVVPEKENKLTRHLDPNVSYVPAVAIEVTYTTLYSILKELTAALVVLIESKKETTDYIKKMKEIEQAIDQTKAFIGTVQSQSRKDYGQHIAILHAIDHIIRLTNVIKDYQKVNPLYFQERLMTKWCVVLQHVLDLMEQEKMLEIEALLEATSNEIANERKQRRDEYLARSIDNETELEYAVTKVEALLWIDRLVYHYWRATARMAEYYRYDYDDKE